MSAPLLIDIEVVERAFARAQRTMHAALDVNNAPPRTRELADTIVAHIKLIVADEMVRSERARERAQAAHANGGAK